MKEMKIEKGMYIRTTDGYIAKIIDNKDNVVVLTDDNTTHLRSKIKKASFDIVDLIEEGDIVNGQPIIEHAYQGTLYIEYVYIGGKGVTTIEDYTHKLENEEIESIVTHEQLENMKYEVK